MQENQKLFFGLSGFALGALTVYLTQRRGAPANSPISDPSPKIPLQDEKNMNSKDNNNDHAPPIDLGLPCVLEDLEKKNGFSESPGGTELRSLIFQALKEQGQTYEKEKTSARLWHPTMIQEGLESFSQEQLTPMFPGGGTTGSTFLITSDRKWIVKSLRKNEYTDEPAWIKSLWPSYIAEMNSRKKTLLPRFLTYILDIKPISEFQPTNWVVMRNANSAEVKTKQKASEAFMCDMKGFSQLYQRAISDFFFIQGPTSKVSQYMSSESFRQAWKADLVWLNRFQLVDYSLVIFRVPVKNTQAPEIDFNDEGVTFNTENASYSCCFIDILSVLEGHRIKSSEERGIKYNLPCGKFTNYSEQTEGLFELLQDTHFAKKVFSEINKITTNSSRLISANKIVSLKKLAAGLESNLGALDQLEDLIKIKLIAKYIFEHLKDNSPQHKVALNAPLKFNPHAKIVDLLKEADLKDEVQQKLSEYAKN